MTLAFYKVDNELGYGRHTFDDIADKPEQIKEMLSKLSDEELIIYDLNHYGYGNVPSPNLADFETDYNDEVLDGGWWCVVIKENN